jgi:hypothetical protein
MQIVAYIVKVNKFRNGGITMFFDTLEQKLEKIRAKHNEKLAIMKLDNELKITENKLKNELKLQELNAENGQLEIKRNIFNLNNTTKKDYLTIKSGHKLKFFALLTTFVSTCLTIAGGYKDFNSSIYTLIPYIIAIIVLQLTVYKYQHKKHVSRQNLTDIIIKS